MPKYQYRCQSCSRELEVFQKFTDAALTECPECEGTLRKVFSAVGVVFKGSGFYATDSRKKSSTSDSPTASTASASAEKSSGSSSAEKSSGSSSAEKSSSGSATTPAA